MLQFVRMMSICCLDISLARNSLCSPQYACIMLASFEGLGKRLVKCYVLLFLNPIFKCIHVSSYWEGEGGWYCNDYQAIV